MSLWLDVIPLWLLFFGAIVGMFLCAECGYRLGCWRRAAICKETDAPVGGMVGAGLGLLAFLLAITFSLAAERFDERRAVLLDEANAIGTTYLRAGMLPDLQRAEVRRLLTEYVDLRIAAAAHQAALTPAVQRSEALHAMLWTQAEVAAKSDPRSISVGLFVEALNEMIDLHAARLQAGLRSRLPGNVWTVLLFVAALSFAMMGYQCGLSATARSPAIVVVTLSFAAVLWLVVDLERPHEGVLRVSQQPMIDLRTSMTADAPTTAPAK